MIRSLFIASLLFFSCETFSYSGSLLKTINMSKPMEFLQKHITTSLSIGGYFAREDASEEYQKLGKEAQLAVGVPQCRLLSIKKIDSNSPLNEMVTGLTDAGGIYINQARLDSYS